MSARHVLARAGLRRSAAVGAAVLLALGLGACSAGSSSDQATSADSGAADTAGGLDAAEAPEAAAEGSSSARTTDPSSSAIVDTAVLDQRDVIRTGQISLQASDPGTVRDDVVALAGRYGGYVADESRESRRSGEVDTYRVTLQVPTGRFDDAVDALSDLAKVTDLSVTSEDVTTQVADVDSRVRTAQASLDRIRALLDRATDLGKVIRLEGVLSQRQADLESLLAQQKVLASQTTMATLDVSVTVPPADDEVAPPPPTDETRGFVDGLEAGWNGLSDAFVVASTAVGAMLPFGILGALLVAPVVVWHRRRPTPPAQTP